MAGWMLGFFLAVLLICPGHVDAYWAPLAERAQYCWTTTKFLYALTWSDVGTDIIVLVMPVPSVLRLHMTPRKKFAVIAIFSLGAVTLAASILRAVFYLQLLHAEKTVAATLDPNMIDTNGLYWMLVETGLTLIAVNLPFPSNASKSSKNSSTSKASDESYHHGDRIDLVYGVEENSKSVATHRESMDPHDVEEGRIHVTKSYAIDER